MAKRKTSRRVNHGQWSSTGCVVLAAAGATIGLNNFWQFPYAVGQYGGGAFLLLYLLSMALIGLPLLMAEFMIGRMGRASPVNTFKRLIERSESDPNWLLLGSVLTFTGFLVLSYLSVIGGWVIAYGFRAALGVFNGLTADGIASVFADFAADPEKQIFWHSLFLVMTMVVVARGLKAGFEPVVRNVVPALFLLLLVLLVYAATLPGFKDAAATLFLPDWEALSGSSVLMAMGHAFFSLALGFGGLLMYGAFLPDDAPISKISTTVIVLDVVAGLMGGMLVYAILFAAEQAPVSGPALVFQALPLALDELPYGQLVMAMFFGLLVLAAWMTAIALIEPAVAWLVESHQYTRFQSSVRVGIAVWLLGVVMILSFNQWAFSFEFFGVRKELGIFDALQIFTSMILLPLAGIFVALFAGWALSRDTTGAGLNIGIKGAYDVWHWLVRVVVPILILIVFFSIPKLFL